VGALAWFFGDNTCQSHVVLPSEIYAIGLMSACKNFTPAVSKDVMDAFRLMQVNLENNH